MKIVNIVKSISSTGKVKYFADHIQASFHIQSGGGSAFQFKIEPCTALFDGSTYLALKEVTESHDPDVEKLALNQVHRAYMKYVDTSDGGDYAPARGYDELVVDKKSAYGREMSICLDENRKIYNLGEPLKVEKPAQEFEEIKPVVYKALGTIVNRNTAEYQRALKFFGQKQEDFLRAQEELKKAQNELNDERFDGSNVKSIEGGFARLQIK